MSQGHIDALGFKYVDCTRQSIWICAEQASVVKPLAALSWDRIRRSLREIHCQASRNGKT
jgi:hypothetical protein